MSVGMFDTPGEETNGVESTGGVEETQVETPVEQHSGDENPAWSQYLEGIPDGFKGTVSEAFKKWDSDVTKKFEELHNQYKPYKAYEPFIKNNVDPNVIQAGVNVLQRLQDNPRDFYEKMGQHFGITAEQAQQVTEEAQGQDQPDEDEEYEDSRIAQMQQQQEQIMSLFQQQQEAQLREQANSELDSEIDSLREAHKDITDQDMIPIMRIAVMGSQSNPNFSMENAYRQYAAERQAFLQSRPGNSAPRVISPNGTPGSAPATDANDPDAFDKQQRAHMLELLKQAGQS